MRDDGLPAGPLMALFWHPWYPIFVFFGVFALLLIAALRRVMRKSSWEGLSLVASILGLVSVIGIIETGQNQLVQFIIAGDKERIGEIYR
jgi:asparagine N-glycosylation enzyme membrane subunit Stt3